MNLGELFTKDVVTAAPSEAISEVADKMAKRHVGTVVITDKQTPVGIVTDRDIALAVAARSVSRKDPVSRIMTFPVTTINHKEGILSATRLMRADATRRLPIVDDERRVIGLVSVDDLLVLLGIEIGNLTEAIAPEVEAAVVHRRRPAAAAVYNSGE
ncbi:MAG TPA: CBS domain-containing protein [Tepidisphaeraceae bacterium]|jgi:CBS domain-containing protein|nr:CBS domain-containing protein [Tepidisphaeraceae bacterium]